MTITSRRWLLLWGVMDLFQSLWYTQKSWSSVRTPYLTDLHSIQRLSTELDIGLSSLGMLSWCLQFSIALTTAGFLLGYHPTRYLALAQIPLRLFFLSPSIAPVLLLAGHLPSLFMLALVIGSEVLKGWSLWQSAR